MLEELKPFSLTEILVLSAIARNHSINEAAHYKNSFKNVAMIEQQDIDDRKWLPSNDFGQAQILAIECRFRVSYSLMSVGITLNFDDIEEFGEYLHQDEYDLMVSNRIPNQIYFDTAKAITKVAALIGLLRMQKMFREIFNN